MFNWFKKKELSYEESSETVRGLIDWNNNHPIPTCHSEGELDCHIFDEHATICQCKKMTNKFDWNMNPKAN